MAQNLPKLFESMGTEERKKRERKLRREQIMQAAVELLSDKGFSQTTMDEIADRAELSKGSLYFYFDDKADLYRAIQKKALQMIHDEFLRILQEDEPGAVLIKKMAKSFLDFIEEFPVYTKAMSPHNGHLCPGEIKKIEKLEKELQILTTRALQIGIQDGSIETKTDPKILAVQIGFCMRGIHQLYISNTQGYIFEVLEENHVTLSDIMKLFINALLKQIDTDSKNVSK